MERSTSPKSRGKWGIDARVHRNHCRTGSVYACRMLRGSAGTRRAAWAGGATGASGRERSAGSRRRDRAGGAARSCGSARSGRSAGFDCAAPTDRRLLPIGMLSRLQSGRKDRVGDLPRRDHDDHQRRRGRVGDLQWSVRSGAGLVHEAVVSRRRHSADAGK
jgi:hypothetical protein